MNFSTILKLAYVLVFASALHLPNIDKRSNSTTSPFSVGFSLKRGSNHQLISTETGAKAKLVFNHGVTKKDGTASVTIENEKTFYLVDVEVGSNKDKNQVLIDTGSSDLWVVASDANCQGVDCKNYGTFDESSSSSYKDLNENFKISYGDGSGASGNWATDDVTVGDVEVSALQFAVATQSSSDIGVLGIATKNVESSDSSYNNLPYALQKQGKIDKVAYSLYLNSKSAASGTLLFGGIDHAKYSGSLVKFPYSGYGFNIQLNSIDYNGDSNSFNDKVLLDSGTTLTYLPQDIVDSIGKALNGSWDSSAGIYTIDCDQPDDKYIEYKFNGLTIKVPLSDLVFDFDSSSSCALGYIATSNTYILGDNFLRNAYVYYDLDDTSISLAQVVFTDSTDIETV